MVSGIYFTVKWLLCFAHSLRIPALKGSLVGPSGRNPTTKGFITETFPILLEKNRTAKHKKKKPNKSTVSSRGTVSVTHEALQTSFILVLQKKF